MRGDRTIAQAGVPSPISACRAQQDKTNDEKKNTKEEMTHPPDS